jgi:hypothetical protein
MAHALRPAQNDVQIPADNPTQKYLWTLGAPEKVAGLHFAIRILS